MSAQARAVCRHRHPLEWLSRVPRREACEECAEIVRVVLDTLDIVAVPVFDFPTHRR